MAATDYFVCPYCGEELPAKARACSNCGSDEKTGWSVDTYLDGLDIPSLDDDEYEEIRAKEFGGGSSPDKTKGRTGFRVDFKVIIGAVVLTAMIFSLLFSIRC